MTSTIRRSIVPCLVALGWAAAAGAAPNSDPHDQVIPGDDASHACPALEAKYDRAKSDALRELFANQLWAHGCRTCDDPAVELIKFYTDKSDAFYTVDRVESVEKVLEADKKSGSLEYYQKLESYAAVLVFARDAQEKEATVRSEELMAVAEADYRVLVAKVESVEAVKLVAEIADNECYSEVTLEGRDITLYGCRQALAESKLQVDADCATLQKELLPQVR